ncbi:preprotein translocase subunit SecY [Campylobacter hyointestinalis]|uniref:Protein translocase subunit SecY n=1 Tax=Campylobacter hyointestinalis subsp. hyointestinalis TaxID=91352 RepID=A0A855N191_CAMHY|nr:preprotein translocase subunit SecY [Campylobacter hyointestinalis]ANE31822.1 preprotein translocase SecYEG, SecY subunit [Campylobacter hyointestinalis subsp. hyointestinalis LMG 9260]MBT0612349.1 preprotein translocase subunit SecY [Campylobacter hyointestinalis subsp. hyointestinalis]MDL2346037.1 preprotein translocase subunit SecY [Campylobacter hyointestinalis]MDL2347777.1 preprotein translocase subunit SecY [Campylobacter hyointestinalis]MDL2349519.1 preprotein translocase subunit Sec
MNKTLINKILITLGFLFAYRVLAYVPVPGVNIDVIKEFFTSNSSNALGMFNMFSGGAAERLSIISLGIMPYITSSIIMELLAATFPNLGKMKKERDGMQKYMQIIRYVTIVITVVQAIGVSIGLQSLTGRGGEQAIMIDINLFIAISCASMLTGTMLLMWIGEQITQRGIGNGISLIIFAGIVSGIPNAIGGTINLVNTGEMNFLVVIGIALVILITVGIVIFVEMGERRVPISYSRKTVMQNQNKRIMNYIPIKVNLSGVIPPIFASAILMFPSTILQASTNEFILAINDFLNPNSYFFNFLTFLFILFFAYFYASITFNAKDISENLKRQGGFIPGVRPGESTATYLNEVASRLTFTGSIYLGLISTLPWILVKFMGVPFYFGGTSVLIVVSVALDTMRKIEAQIYMNKYQTLSAVGL